MFFIKKVLIIFGGNSSEHYVSCKSAKSIIENIDKKLFKYQIAGIDFDNTWYKFSDDLDYLENGSWKEANILKVDNINLKFTDEAIDEMAEMAAAENETSENIGARRLHTIMEHLLEDISFNATGEHPMLDVVVDRVYVQNAFKESKKKFDLSKYVL